MLYRSLATVVLLSPMIVSAAPVSTDAKGSPSNAASAAIKAAAAARAKAAVPSAVARATANRPPVGLPHAGKPKPAVPAKVGAQQQPRGANMDRLKAFQERRAEIAAKAKAQAEKKA